MKPDCAATIFQVTNVEMAIKYYTNVLGFTLDFRYNDLAGLKYDDILIYLSGPGQGVKKAVGQGSIYIFCDEIDEYFQDISDRGVFVEVVPDDRPYGMRDFAISDQDGNVLTFGRQSETSI